MHTVDVGGVEQFPIGFGTYRLAPLLRTGRADVAAGVIRAAIDSGITLLDTAAAYADGAVEVLLGTVLGGRAPGITVATKAGFRATGSGPWRPDGHPHALRRSCEGSLRRLRVERLAIVQLHTVDPEVPLEESLGALADLRAEGKIAHVGLSNVTPDEVTRAARSMPIVSVQNCYNVADRHAEPVLSLCEALGPAFLPWFPLARGLATQHPTLRRVATRHGVTPAQVALAWLLKRSDRLVAIPGSASTVHVAENANAAWVALDARAVRELDEVAGSQPPLIVDDSSLRTRDHL